MVGAIEKLLEIKRGAIGKARIKKCISNTRTLETLGKKPIDKVLASLDETKSLSEKIDNSDYSPATKSDLRLILKMLWKVANNYDLEDRPREVRFLKIGVKRKDKKHPKKISEEDFRAMLSFAGGRDKAILSLLYEGGLRPHELLSLKKNSVEFTKDGARVDIPEGTKTGARNILVIDAEPALASWLSSHPIKGENSILFPALNGRGLGKKMSVENLNKMVKALAAKAGITRRIKPYDFRHTAATRLAAILTDSQMKAYFGWTQDSSMAATYVNLSGRDVDNPLLAAHGKKIDKSELEGKLEPKICKRCGKQNAHDAILCQYCGLSFDKDKAKSDNLSMQEQIAAMKAQILQIQREQLKKMRTKK